MLLHDDFGARGADSAAAKNGVIGANHLDNPGGKRKHVGRRAHVHGLGAGRGVQGQGIDRTCGDAVAPQQGRSDAGGREILGRIIGVVQKGAAGKSAETDYASPILIGESGSARISDRRVTKHAGGGRQQGASRGRVEGHDTSRATGKGTERKIGGARGIDPSEGAGGDGDWS